MQGSCPNDYLLIKGAYCSAWVRAPQTFSQVQADVTCKHASSLLENKSFTFRDQPRWCASTAFTTHITWRSRVLPLLLWEAIPVPHVVFQDEHGVIHRRECIWALAVKPANHLPHRNAQLLRQDMWYNGRILTGQVPDRSNRSLPAVHQLVVLP